MEEGSGKEMRVGSRKVFKGGSGKELQERSGKEMQEGSEQKMQRSGKEMQEGSGKEMQRSGKEMQRGSGKEMQEGSGKEMQEQKMQRSGKEMQRGSGKETQTEFWEMTLKKHLKQSDMQKRGNTKGLVDALCRHREILRRDNSFLRTEVAFRNLGTIDGIKAYLEETQQMSGLSNQKMESSEIKVSLPYLVSNHQEALDFLLHESLELRNRIQSLASIMSEFNIPISVEKLKMLLIMSRTLLCICRHILRSDEIKSREENKVISRKGKKKAISISSYERHRIGWKSRWGRGAPNCGFFNDITTLSSMPFTCYPPAIIPYYGTTGPALQIYSIKIVELNANLDWPLRVYGVVAARDDVDHNRNMLFNRSSHNYQELTENDPYLHLTGPSRAIVAAEPVTFEVNLRIMYGPGFQDTALMSSNYRYWSKYDDMPEIASGCCTIQLSHEQLGKAIQATIVGVQVVEGGWPFEGGCQVSCFSSAAAKSIGNGEVLLLDCCGGEMPIESDGYIRLSRQVVSAKVQGTLRVCIKAFSQDSGIAASGHVDIPVKHCQTSDTELFIGTCKVKVVIAWSLLLMDKESLMVEGYVAQA